MGSGNIVWSLVAQADFISKLILVILLCMSFVCWIIGVVKIMTLHIKCKQLSEGLERIRYIYTFDSLMHQAHTLHGTFVGSFLAKAALLIKKIMQQASSEHIIVHEKEIPLFEAALDELIIQEVATEEKYTSFLATSAEVAPLIGLFGTVWGIIHSFIRISEAHSSDISIVAPGIAEALITTLAGLIVAIPALVLYHYLSKKIEMFEKNLKILAYHFELIVKKHS